MTSSHSVRKLGAVRPQAALNKLLKAVKAKPLPAERVSVTNLLEGLPKRCIMSKL